MLNLYDCIGELKMGIILILSNFNGLVQHYNFLYSTNNPHHILVFHFNSLIPKDDIIKRNMDTDL